MNDIKLLEAEIFNLKEELRLAEEMISKWEAHWSKNKPVALDWMNYAKELEARIENEIQSRKNSEAASRAYWNNYIEELDNCRGF